MQNDYNKTLLIKMCSWLHATMVMFTNRWQRGKFLFNH